MVLSIIALLVSFIPSVLLYIYLRNSRGDDEEYVGFCREAVKRGLLCVVYITLADLIVSLLANFTGINKMSPVIVLAFRCFIINAFVEEGVKYLNARKVMDSFSRLSWLDCIAFMAIVGLTFGMAEDVVYIFSTSIGQIIVRGILMGHAPYGVIMGYFIGKYLYTNEKSNLLIGLIVPILVHGLYNFSLGYQGDIFIFLPFILIAVERYAMIRILLLFNKARKEAGYEQYNQPLK